MIDREQFINEIIRVAREQGYRIESNARTGQVQINFGKKKLHAGHLSALYPRALDPNENIARLIDQVAPGRPCSHKPMREIISQLQE